MPLKIDDLLRIPQSDMDKVKIQAPGGQVPLTKCEQKFK